MKYSGRWHTEAHKENIVAAGVYYFYVDDELEGGIMGWGFINWGNCETVEFTQAFCLMDSDRREEIDDHLQHTEKLSNCVESVDLCYQNDHTNHTASLFTITFGSGLDSYLNETSDKFDFSISTDYQQKFGSKMTDAAFDFVHVVPNHYPDWRAGEKDHTENHTKGYMYIVSAGPYNSHIFNRTVNHLCIGNQYIFSAYIANIAKKGFQSDKPNIQFEVRSATDNSQLLAKCSTSDIDIYDEWTWTKYSLVFNASTASIILLMMSMSGAHQGADMAIDDIELHSTSSEYPNFCSFGTCPKNNSINEKTLLSITFGSGIDKYSNYKTSDFNFTTILKETNDRITFGSDLAFVNVIPTYQSTWHVGAFDHTENDDVRGYMYMIDIKHIGTELFRYAFSDLCVGSQYTFSAYIANVDKVYKNRIIPNVRFEVRNSLYENEVLAQFDAGEIRVFDQLTWLKYGVSFNPTTSSVVLLLISNSGGLAGNNIVVDDIELRFCSSIFSNICLKESNSLCVDEQISNEKSLVLITFGSGSEQYSTSTPSDFHFKTSHKQGFTFAEMDNNGWFSFINAIPFQTYGWHTSASDHTSNDNKGYMYLIKAGNKGTSIFNFIYHGLCIGSRYEFTAYIANLQRNSSESRNPIVLFEVRTATKEYILLTSFKTSEILQYSEMTWLKYGVSFIALHSSVVLLMISDAHSDIGNDFAVDDIELRACSSSPIELIPNAPLITKPLTIRQSQDFYITSRVSLNNIDQSTSFTYQWTLFLCSPTCSFRVQLFNNTYKHLFLQSSNLSLGIYELRLAVISSSDSSMISSTSSVYIQIVSSHIVTHLVSLSRTNLTHRPDQDLHLEPGKYSTAPNKIIFFPKKWHYIYYWRLYDFENPYTIDEFRLLNDSINLNTSMIIQYQSFKLNTTYQLMVHMIHQDDSSLQSIGYLFVHIEEIIIRTIKIDCSIASKCSSISDFQYLNPNMDLTLLSSCFDYCASIQNITWKIYSDQNSIISLNDINSVDLKIPSNFFEENTKEIISWQFTVFYSFPEQIINKTITIKINKPPKNGSCSVDPLNGTVDTLFTINCSNWTDPDEIKDYTYYGWTKDRTKKLMFGSTNETIFKLKFPPIINEIYFYHSIVHIRDNYGSITEMNLSTITIYNNRSTSIEVIESFEETIRQSNDPVNLQQQISSFSDILNDLNEKNLDQLIEDGISPASISISSLSNRNLNRNSTVIITEIPAEFDKNLVEHAQKRENLMGYMVNLTTLTIDDLNLQSAIISELTQTTSQLTRKTSTLAADKCHQLSDILETSKTQIPMKNIRLISTHLLQCTSNVMTGINGPLHGRTKLFDIGSDQINSECLIYDDEHQMNLCQQKATANNIRNQISDTIKSITSVLVDGLTLNESIVINTPSVYFSLENISIHSLTNQSSNLRRLMIEPIPFINDIDTQLFINFSRSVSLSILNEYNQEISINTSYQDPIEIIIPRDTNLIISSMFEQNVTDQSMIFNYHQYQLQRNYSIHFEFQSLNSNLSYLLVYQFDRVSSKSRINGWTPFCSTKNKTTIDDIFQFYLNNNQTFNHQTITFGIRELTSKETEQYCQNQIFNLPVINTKITFTSNYKLRSYLASCFYLHSNKKWQSDGLLVGPQTNHYQTHCLSTHL